MKPCTGEGEEDPSHDAIMEPRKDGALGGCGWTFTMDSEFWNGGGAQVASPSAPELPAFPATLF